MFSIHITLEYDYRLLVLYCISKNILLFSSSMLSSPCTQCYIWHLILHPALAMTIVPLSLGTSELAQSMMVAE
jgi:uncharacterized membrane protein YozB (DUF420 family)